MPSEPNRPEPADASAPAEASDEASNSEVSVSPADQGPTIKGLEIPAELPVLAVRNVVVFPGMLIPLAIGREKSKRLVDAALSSHKLVAIVTQRLAETEDPAPDDLYTVGTASVILRLVKAPDGTPTVLVQGLARVRLHEFLRTEPYLVARIETHHDQVAESTELEALVHSVRQAALRVVELSPNIPNEAAAAINQIESPGALADFLAGNLPEETARRQELLETFDVLERLRKVHTALVAHLDVLELSHKIQGQVKQQIDKSQREYFLQEQLKAIQKELGQEDARTAEIEGLRKRVKAAHMPEAVEKEAERELDRMGRIPQASPEYSVARDYVEWLCELPWSVSTTDSLDIAQAERILDEDHHDLEKVKKRILEFLAVRKLKPTGRGPILCFAGPPGVGKTSLGQSIARALGRKFIRISLGGIRDEADIRGHRRTYIGALPGRIIQEIRKVGCNNPVFMLDEVDKIGADFRGDPGAALLEVLDPEQNHSFTDHYLDVPFDLSKVMFIATANYTDPIAPALRDRMEVIELPGYSHQDKMHIARKYLVPRQLEEHGLKPEQLTITDAALSKIIESYTREAGVRNLERQIGAICRAVATQIARGTARSARITPGKLTEILGPAQFEPELALRTSVPGVVTGLAYTPAGGEIIFVEASRMPGQGRLTLTGHIGDVMKESAQAAFSLLRSRSGDWNIDAKTLASSDIHIHVPAGAIPKDGPSAGVAMLAALVSLFTSRPARADVAMTGEITLRGLVLPVGGLKEKVLAAHRAGIGTVILPERNKKDLVDVPKEVRRKINFVLVRDIDQVVATALEPPPTRRARTRKKNAGKKSSTQPAKTASRRAGRAGRRSAARSR